MSAVFSLGGHALHLVRRFHETRRNLDPEPGEEAWATSRLSSGELLLWEQQPGVDRRHAIGVAQRVLSVEPNPPDWVIAAALLHDVGKIEAGLGVYGRVVAALIEPVGKDRVGAVLERFPGVLGRIGLQLNYTERGAQLLAAAQSDPRTAAWAREHHLVPTAWTIPAEWGHLLSDADDG